MNFADEQPVKTLAVVLTEDCSLRCSYCFCGEKSKENLSFNRAKDIVDWFASKEASGDVNKLRLVFWGGEPMMRMDLIENIVDYCKTKDKKFTFGMTTNGMHLTDENIKKLKELGVDTLVSLDGGPESHNKFRKLPNGEGSYEHIEENLKKYLEHFPGSNVRLSLSSHNVERFSGDVKHLYNLGFRSIFWSPVLEDDWSDEDVSILRKEYFEVADFYIKKALEGDKFRVKWFHDGIKNLLYPGRNKYFCGAGRTYLSAGLDGRIYPCHRFDKFENDTSAEEEPFCLGTVDDGLMNQKERNMFCNGDHFAYCKDCKLYKLGFCKGSCYAGNVDFSGGDILYSPPIHCAEVNIRFDVANYIYKKTKDTDFMKRKISRIHKKMGNPKNLGSINCGHADLEYDGGPLIEEDDYYKDNTEEDMELDLLQKYFQADGKTQDALIYSLLEKKTKEVNK